MRTIGTKRPASSPIGDYQAMCSYCGVVWLRSELWKDEQGFLVCPDEGPGLDQVALSREIAASSVGLKRRQRPHEGYPGDHNDDPDPTIGNPTPFDPSVIL